MIRRLFLFVTGIGLLAGLLGATAAGKKQTFTILSVAEWMLPPICLLLFFFVATVLMSAYVARFKSHLIRGITYQFTSGGMQIVSTKLEAQIPWANFLRLKETRSFFLIHVKENKTDNVHVIQKRMLSREDAEGFRKFIERNMPL